MPRPRTLVKVAAAALAAALLLPFLVNVNRFRAQIVRALGAGLGRPVQAASVRLKLVSGPGFDLQNVTIGEDPAFGIEPFARMATLRATLRLRSLWTGRLSFSSLVFVEPSVNLARNAEGRWNLEPLLARASATSRFLAAPPYIELQDARINFKSGDTKSVFFLSGVDAAFYSTSEGPKAPRRLHLRFNGSPARTDRKLTDVGQIRVEGSFGQRAPTLRMQVDLADAYLADLGVLASGADSGIHGVLDVKTAIEGEPAALRVSGSARLRDLHRWDMQPPEAGSSFDLQFEALLNGPARVLQVQKVQANLSEGTLEGGGSVTNFLEQPQWRFNLRFNGARASRVFGAARRLSPGMRWLPETVRLGGTLDGALALQGPPARVDGSVAARNLEILNSGLPPIRMAEARASLFGTTLSLEPATLEVEGGQNLDLSAAWNWQSGAGELSAGGRDLSLRGISGLLRAAGQEAVSGSAAAAAEGRVSFNLRGELARDAPARWTGWGQLARVRWAPAGVAAPVVVHTAWLDFLGDQVRAGRIVASWGGATITGTVRVPAGPAPVYAADLRADTCEASALAAALGASGRGAAERQEATPADRDAAPFRAEGRLAVGRLRLRRVVLEAVEGAFRLTGRRLELEQARAVFAGGSLAGSARLDFSASGPMYQVSGRVRDLDVDRLAALSPRLEGAAAGHASGSLQLSSSGWSAADLLDNLSMRLRLQGRDLLLRNVNLESAAGHPATPAPGPPLGPLSVQAAGQPNTAAGSLVHSFTADLAVERRWVRLQHVVLVTPSATFQAAGTVGFDRIADIEVLPLRSPRQATVPGERALLHAFRLVGPLELPATRRLEPLERRAKEEARKPAGDD